MISDFKVFAMSLCVGLLSFGIAGLAAAVERRRWHRDCIKRGFAHYNPITGYWQWSDPPIEEQIAELARGVTAEETNPAVINAMAEAAQGVLVRQD